MLLTHRRRWRRARWPSPESVSHRDSRRSRTSIRKISRSSFSAGEALVDEALYQVGGKATSCRFLRSLSEAGRLDRFEPIYVLH